MRSMVLVGLLAWAMPVMGQAVEYDVTIDPGSVVATVRGGERHVSLTFRIQRAGDKTVVTEVRREEIVVLEERQPVLELEVFPPRDQKLTVVLAIDISGSMARSNKMEQSKRAALAFLDKLDPRADVGLILFDHQVQTSLPPARDAARVSEHREKVRQLIRDARPQGGTAYFDATVASASLLKNVPGRRAVIVLTDGVDTNSKANLEDAINAGHEGELPVYTVGIGQPGRNEPVTTVLVLDRSGSMMGLADASDRVKKIDALKKAAKRFIDLMRHGARTTILPFSDVVDAPEAFSDNHPALKARIDRLRPRGGTLLYDATLSGVETLMAGDPVGRRAVVALTDGQDEAPGSRNSDEAVITRAREAKVPLYMLGLGRPEEVNEPVMRRMAEQTGGAYYHAGSEQKLIEVFEALSIQLHDDGIDEESLGKLARETGGRYTHVSDLSQLALLYERLAEELQQTYRVKFKSRRSRDDGTARDIDVIVRRGGRTISTVGRADDVARGIVVPQMNYVVYLGFLVGLLGLLTIPESLRRVYRSLGGN